jgi:mutator protein MutT
MSWQTIAQYEEDIENEEVEEAITSAAAVILLRENRAKGGVKEVFLLKRGPSAPWMPNYWNFPGGGIEDGETPMAAAVRECMEESGAVPSNLIALRSVKGSYGTLYPFLCNDFSGVASVNDSESSNSAWVSLEDLYNYSLVEGIESLIRSVLK